MSKRFNGATLRTRGIRFRSIRLVLPKGPASMGPRLGRVEYVYTASDDLAVSGASMGPRLGRVEYGRLARDLGGRSKLQWGHA